MTCMARSSKMLGLAASVAATAARGASHGQLGTLASRLRVVLCADFDETVTRRDTTQLLFQLAGRAEPLHAALVRRLVDRYVSDIAAFLDAYPRASPGYARAFDAQALDAFLAGYAATDMRSVQRVVHARALRGIETREIQEMGRTVALREGCADVFAAVPDVHVVSTNWSAEMVRAAVASVASGRVRVCANELVMDGRGVSTGEIAVVVQSPADKVREVRRIRDGLNHAQPRQDLAVVFVGDGVNDVLAMLEADVGISLQDAKDERVSASLSTLHGVASRHGIAIEPLSRLHSLQECVDAAVAAKAVDSRVIFSATSWADIARVLPTSHNGDFSE